MLHAGLDLSRHRLDVCLLDEQGSTVQVTTAPPDADGLRGLARQTAAHGVPVRAAVESMNGARFVHDQLELSGWQVAIADAQKVKGLAPLACKTDRIDAWVLAELSRRDLVPEIWLPTPRSGLSGNGPDSGFTWSATAPRSRTASTPPCWPSASRARSATCSAPAAGNCLDAWYCPSRGSATLPQPWRSSTT
jgi:hypothetical protein